MDSWRKMGTRGGTRGRKATIPRDRYLDSFDVAVGLTLFQNGLWYVLSKQLVRLSVCRGPCSCLEGLQ